MYEKEKKKKEIKDILAYLKTIDNGKDNLAVQRIINVPKRAIGETTLKHLQEYADEKVAKRDKEMAIALLKEKVFTVSKIAELTKLSVEEVNALQQEHLQNA